MRGPWLLVFFMVQAGYLVKILDGSLLGWIEPDEPSCDELRQFWNAISQSMRMSEVTNEIPLIPWEVFSYIIKFQQKLGRQKHFKTEDIRTDNPLQETYPAERNTFPNTRLRSPMGLFSTLQEPQVLPKQQLHGIFEDFGDQIPASWETSNSIFNPLMTQSSTKKKGGSEIRHSSPWGEPKEIGTFGRFVDFNEHVPVISRNRESMHSMGMWSDSLHASPAYSKTGRSCLQVASRDCTEDEQCVCAGWNILRCIQGKCNNYHTNGGKDTDFGIWHDGPLPRASLGLLKRLQKRSNKSIFM